MRINATFFSKVLGQDTGITVVTPEDYRQRQYKAAYLFHGVGGDDKSWLQYSLIPVYAERGETVYISPSVSRSFYTDMRFGKKYFTYVTEELPKVCKSLFNISDKREDTAVIGASMGGYGALKCAFTYPERYGYCAAFSSCCLFMKRDLEHFRGGNMEDFKNIYGEQLVNDFIAMFGTELMLSSGTDIPSLAKDACKKQLPRLYLTCGTEDGFHGDHLLFAEKLKELDIPFEYEEWKAKHDFIYFNEALRRTIEKFSL